MVAGLGLAMLPASLAFGCMFLFGLGLGGTMTAISLLLQRRTQGQSQALVRLNLLWALGASLCPVLALSTLRTGKPGAILYPLALCFFALMLWAVREEAGEREATGDARPGTVLSRHVSGRQRMQRFAVFFHSVPPVLILLVMLATGIEAATGGWLATYATRGGDAFAGIVAAPTCLWAGVLLSRLFWSVMPRVKQERFVIQGSLVLMAGAALTLLEARHGWPFFCAALLLGAGVGPIYPLLLAKALRFHASGTIFFLAGVGSAVLPWLMGFVSTHKRSLHAGFYVPAVGACVMAVLSLWVPAERVGQGLPEVF